MKSLKILFFRNTWNLSLWGEQDETRIYIYIYTYIYEGSYLPSNRNSPKTERIEKAPFAILISTEQF